jgi:thiol-disulfide isomerase/thioredoxin
MRALLPFIAVAVFGCSSGANPVVETAPSAKAVTAAPYPAGPYGIGVGATVPPTFTWNGLGPGGTAQSYASTDFFDSDGSKGINAIVFDSSGEWCGACQQEATELEGIIQSNWGPNGVAVITLMIQDNNQQPTTDIGVATWWMTQFHLSDVPVALDPMFDFAIYTDGTLGLPYNVLVNPRNMQVVKSPYTPGPGGHDADMDALIAANQLQ